MWSDWTNCSQECGSGLKNRTREHTPKNVECPDHSVESEVCNVEPCEGMFENYLHINGITP